MSVQMTQWAQDVYAGILGVPEPAVIDGVRNAAREFCKRTLLWTFELDRISVVASQSNYTLSVPSNQYGEIILVDDAKYKQNGQDDDQFVHLDPISENEMDLDEWRSNTSRGGWKYQTAATPSKFWLDPDDRTILYLYRTPTEASTQGLLVRVCLKPTKAAEVVPDFLYYQHYETILAGAFSDLYGRRQMPWFDAQEAGVHGAAFAMRTNNAKTIKWSGLGKKPMRARMRQFV